MRKSAIPLLAALAVAMTCPAGAYGADACSQEPVPPFDDAALTPAAMAALAAEVPVFLAQRRAAWKPKPRKYRRGVRRMFSEHAASPMEGAYLKFDNQ